MNRFVRPALGLVALCASALPAQNQTVRWNDLVASLGEQQADPPAVRVWLDQSFLRWGDPVRVGYRVEEDAFVVVARVDWNGNLTVLHPTSRNRVTSVSGREDHYIRSARMGPRATFVANERPGSTGYVFAIASRTPLDVSRLGHRDFSAWVTGIGVGQPVSRYFGDPYRVIQRFLRLVLFDPMAEWDYDMEFYSVDQPSYVSTASMSSYCGGVGYRGYGRSFNSYYADMGLDDGYGFAGGYGCRDFYGYLSCYNPFYGYGYIIPVFCAGPIRRQQVATGPGVPPTPTDVDSARVNSWAPDSVQRPNVDKGTGGNPNGPHIMTVDPARPNPVATGWRDDLSFSIPSRALRGMRERTDDFDRIPRSGGNGGTVPLPARPTPEVGDQQPIEWVRPPRSLDGPPRTDIDRMPTRGGIRRDQASVSTPERNGNRGWSPPPPRASSPIFERDPGRSPGYSAPIRDYGGGNRGYNPPSHLEGRPSSSPSGMEHRPMTSPSGGSVAPAPPPPAPAKTADPPEKKPSEKH